MFRRTSVEIFFPRRAACQVFSDFLVDPDRGTAIDGSEIAIGTAAEVNFRQLAKIGALAIDAVLHPGPLAIDTPVANLVGRSLPVLYDFRTTTKGTNQVGLSHRT